MAATGELQQPAEATQDHQSKIEWLKDNLEPADKVQEYMEVTANYRRQWIKNKERTVAEILQEFPRLLHSNMVRYFLLFYQITSHQTVFESPNIESESQVIKVESESESHLSFNIYWKYIWRYC